MYKSHTVTFITFADSRLACKDIIRKQAEKSGFFDKIYAFDERDLEDWYREKYADHLVLGSRGFGYWQWKSYSIRRILDRLDDGDFLIYADAGCSINPYGEKRFYEYLDIATESPLGIMAFQEEGLESTWTKGDVFDYFNVYNKDDFKNHPQVATTTFIIRKCWKSVQFVNEWFYVCNNQYDLATDKPSEIPNYPDFIENRHDQSVFSVMSLLYNMAVVPVTEIFSEDGYANMQQYPIWATRYKPKKHSWLWKLYHKLK